MENVREDNTSKENEAPENVTEQNSKKTFNEVK